jgi:Kef-type K+ transport system membrane component KefB
MRLVGHIDLPGTPTMFAVVLAFALAWLAWASGSAMIIGAFAAGLLLRGTPRVSEIERGAAHLGHFFVPLFFVVVGAAVDIRVLNPFDAANRQTLLVGGLLIVAAVVGKFLAGYAPFWFKGNKKVIGVGMIPRGEVGLIFAQMGLAAGVFDRSLFSAVTLMVMVTTFMAPPLLKLLYPPAAAGPPPPKPEGIEDLCTEA